MLNQYALKWLAIICMTLDHIGYLLTEASPCYFAFRILGRVTLPIMAFFIAEGYANTRSLRKYALRLLLFAALSAVPFALLVEESPQIFWILDGNQVTGDVASLYLPGLQKTICLQTLPVLFPLLLGLLAIALWERTRLPWPVKLLLTVPILWLSLFGDGGCFAVLLCLCFHFLKDRPAARDSVYAALAILKLFSAYPRGNPFLISWTGGVSVISLGLLLAIPILRTYDGTLGKKTAFRKWLFYAYYPLHMVALWWIFS